MPHVVLWSVMRKLHTLPRRNLSEIAADSIREYIFENALTAGDRLPTEAELMRILGVSRSTVREAIKQVQMGGILEVKPGQGATITELDQEALLRNMSWGVHLSAGGSSLRELADARKAVELGILPLVVANIDEKDLRELRVLHERMASTKNLARHRQLDASFHQLLLRSTRNRPVIHMGSILLDLFRKKAEIYPDSMPDEDLNLTNQEHGEIVEACETRNLARLRDVMGLHLSRD